MLVAVLVPMVVCVDVVGWVDDGVGVEESSVVGETVGPVVEAVDGAVLSAVHVGEVTDGDTVCVLAVVGADALVVVAEADALLADEVEGAPVVVECVPAVLLPVEDWLDVDVWEGVVDGVDDVSDGVVVGPVSWVVVAVGRDVV